MQAILCGSNSLWNLSVKGCAHWKLQKLVETARFFCRVSILLWLPPIWNEKLIVPPPFNKGCRQLWSFKMLPNENPESKCLNLQLLKRLRCFPPITTYCVVTVSADSLTWNYTCVPGISCICDVLVLEYAFDI